MADDSLTAARVRELLDYDPATGAFRRKVRTAQRHQVGDRADFAITAGDMAGYRRVSVDSERYLAHRMAWLYVYGEWPGGDLDHINGDRGDNRIENLRDVPRRMNQENFRRARKDNRCGLLGVQQASAGKWRARIHTGCRCIELGRFDSPEAAYAAYVAAKRRLHEGCTI